MTRIEWPKGSGRFADYTDAERAFMRKLAENYWAGKTTHEEMINEITALHEMKIEFGINIAPEPPKPPRNGVAGGKRARDEAMERVDTNADPDFKDRAYTAVHELALAKPDLVADDVWMRLGIRPREPRVMGPILVASAKRGWIVLVPGETRKAYRVINHARPQQVWQSLLWRQP